MLILTKAESSLLPCHLPIQCESGPWLIAFIWARSLNESGCLFSYWACSPYSLKLGSGPTDLQKYICAKYMGWARPLTMPRPRYKKKKRKRQVSKNEGLALFRLGMARAITTPNFMIFLHNLLLPSSSCCATRLWSKPLHTMLFWTSTHANMTLTEPLSTIRIKKKKKNYTCKTIKLWGSKIQGSTLIVIFGQFQIHVNPLSPSGEFSPVDGGTARLLWRIFNGHL